MNVKARLSIIRLLIILIPITNYCCGQAKNNSSDKQVIVMLKGFYTSYINVFSTISPAQIQKLNSIKAKYCTASLLAKIENQLKSGELDYDPFLKAQDVDTGWLKTLSFEKDSKKADFYIVSYVDNSSNTKVAIHLTVVKQGENYKIASVW
jgi:hypothetical protein